MNGLPTTATQFTNWYSENFASSGISFLASGGANWVPGSSSVSSSVTPSRVQPARLNQDYASFAQSSPANNQGFDPWGVKDSPIIDDDERVQSNLETETEIPNEAEEGLSETVEAVGEVTTGVEAAEATAAVSTPWTLLAIANQQLGQAVSTAHVSGLQQQSSADYTANMQSHGLNVGLNADLIREQQSQTISRQQAGGSIGSLLGPLGTLIGQAIAGYNSVNQEDLKTAASFNGYINPQMSNIVASQTTSGDAGQATQVDNVDTTNA
uniref:Uncharacterized protein n=1 Tax=Solenopsis invicta virus 2 TaxID=439491 RepID=A0A346CMP3_9VIRU|nr:hypothetical protein [Solenopsis invicta virus 2]